MTANYTFKDADTVKQSRGAVEIEPGVYCNKDIEVFDTGKPVKTCDDVIYSEFSNDASNLFQIVANSNRKGLMIFNDSGKKLFVRFKDMVDFVNYNFVIPPEITYEMPLPVYRGRITGKWEVSGNGRALVTELV